MLLWTDLGSNLLMPGGLRYVIMLAGGACPGVIRGTKNDWPTYPLEMYCLYQWRTASFGAW